MEISWRFGRRIHEFTPDGSSDPPSRRRAMSTYFLREERSQAASVDEIRRLAALRLQSLMPRLNDTTRAADEIENLREIIESLPLSTAESSLAMNRLRNAQRYLSSDELGAARCELRLLLCGL